MPARRRLDREEAGLPHHLCAGARVRPAERDLAQRRKVRRPLLDRRDVALPHVEDQSVRPGGAGQRRARKVGLGQKTGALGLAEQAVDVVVARAEGEVPVFGGERDGEVHVLAGGVGGAPVGPTTSVIAVRCR